MKLLGLLVLLLLAALLAPVGHGARRRVSKCPPSLRLAPVQVIRSSQAAQTPKIVRAVRSDKMGK
ncbi:MAG: hypothetical protein ACRYG7_33205 [Janthinobacterium lividum]